MCSLLLITVLYIIFTESNTSNPMTPEAEKFNGWAAMIGFIVAIGTYATTGDIIPGIF